MENKDQMSLGKPKNKFLLLASTLFILLVVLLVLVIVNNRSISPEAPTEVANTSGENTPGSQSVSRPQVVATAPPTVSVASWVGIQPPATVPTSASVYTFSTAHTFEKAETIAGILGIEGNIQRNNDMVMAYSLPSESNPGASLLAYKLSNGTFVFTSSEGVVLPAGSTTEQKVTALLRQLQIYDNTLTAVSTYKDRTEPGMLYVEVRRDWSKVGLPILSPVGLLNVPETERLSSLTLATRNSNLPPNQNIYATSDSSDGYVRKDDFNTVTLGIEEATQRVKVIKSGIRPFATAAPSTSSLLTFDQAVEKLQQGQYEFAITAPTGEGASMPWTNIYPMNRAEAETATVTDSVIVYLEHASSAAQSELMPYYLFRANAMLKSGYRAKIIAAVPATAQTNAFLFPFIGVNAQVLTPAGQQQGTFDLDTAPTTAVVPNQGTGNTIPPLGTTIETGTLGTGDDVCFPDPTNPAELSPIYNIGGITYGWSPFRNDRDDKNFEEGFWYYIPTNTDTAILSDLNAILRTLQEGGVMVPNQPVEAQPTQVPVTAMQAQETSEDDQGQKQGTFFVPTTAVTQIPAVQMQGGLNVDDIRDIEYVQKDLKKFASYCPLRVSGSSPSVFVYGETGDTMQVTSGASKTYADPVADHNATWNVEVAGEGNLNVNGLSREFIYYEYDNATFSRPESGWTVRRSALGTTATNISKQLGLTSKEAARLQFELEHAASRVDSNNLFVGLIENKEVESQLPLSVTDGYTVNRVYFYVGEAKGNAVSAPTLEKVVRSPSMVLELGSFGQN